MPKIRIVAAISANPHCAEDSNSRAMTEPVEKTAFMMALMDHKVHAQVVDLDHYRIRGGMAVETDYIIRVEPTEGGNGPLFDSFSLSKTYSHFRTLANQLKKAADRVMMPGKSVGDSTKKLARYCETVHHLVETQRTQYLGKVSFRTNPETGMLANCPSRYSEDFSRINSGLTLSLRHCGIAVH